MCTPAAAIVATIASTAVSAYGSMQAGKAEEAQYNYQAAVDRNNAQVKQWQSDDALKRGKEEERRQRLMTAQKKGAQVVGFAANGIDLGSENVAETLADTAMIGELDALTIRSNAKREAYGYQVEGSNFEASAGAKKIAGKNAKKAGTMNAFSTILGGTNTLTGQFSDNKAKTGSIWGK